MAVIGYKKYTKEILEKDIEGSSLFLFEYGSLKFGVIYQPGYFRNICHLAFHAMSCGFEAYTDTGYKSNFVTTGEEVEDADVEQYFIDALLESGIDVHNPKPVLSRVNEVIELQQLSLF
jgi:hypothetical protein